MASSTREVLITIRLEEGSPITPTPNPQPVPNEVEDDKEKTLKSILIHQGLKVGGKLIAQSISATANRYTGIKEDYFSEQVSQNVSTTLGQFINLASLVGGAIALGGGPVGIGIAVAGFAGSELINLQSKYSGHYKALNASNMNVDFARTRAGLIDNGRGTEN